LFLLKKPSNYWLSTPRSANLPATAHFRLSSPQLLVILQLALVMEGRIMASKPLTAEELAEQLGVRPSTIKTWARRGWIPVIKPSPRIRRFDLDDVLRATTANMPRGKRRQAKIP
jgi:excisionase family DNA binding protein